jgi:hypothetical protein
MLHHACPDPDACATVPVRCRVCDRGDVERPMCALETAVCEACATTGAAVQS